MNYWINSYERNMYVIVNLLDSSNEFSNPYTVLADIYNLSTLYTCDNAKSPVLPYVRLQLLHDKVVSIAETNFNPTIPYLNLLRHKLIEGSER